MNINKEKDPASHYKYFYKGILIDPARIARIYNISSPMLFTVLKKILRAGNGGYKSYRQDLIDCQDALRRELEMIDEDKNNIDVMKWGS